MTKKMEKLENQRDIIKVDLERVNKELKSTQMQNALEVERKTETEKHIKSEIKQLITKLMQTKEKIASNVSVKNEPTKPNQRMVTMSISGNSVRNREELTDSENIIHYAKSQYQSQNDINTKKENRMAQSVCGFSKQPIISTAQQRSEIAKDEITEMVVTLHSNEEENSQSQASSVGVLPKFHKKSLQDLN